MKDSNRAEHSGYASRCAVAVERAGLHQELAQQGVQVHEGQHHVLQHAEQGQHRVQGQLHRGRAQEVNNQPHLDIQHQTLTLPGAVSTSIEVISGQLCKLKEESPRFSG